jgi:antitoxin ParD1/3/4
LTIFANALRFEETNTKKFTMNTMNIAIPKDLKSFVQRQVERRGYSSVSEYVRDLIRGDQERQAMTALEAEFLRGLDSGPSTPMTKQDWQDIREEVRRRTAKRRKSA